MARSHYPEPPSGGRRLIRRNSMLIKVVAVAAMAGGAFVLARNPESKAFFGLILDLLRKGGPPLFFLAMALLPVFGAPLSFFTLTVGSAFGQQIGLTLLMSSSLGAIAISIALGYLLARKAMRPLLGRLVTRLGYKLPAVSTGDATDLIVLLRVTPGLPFPIQNYLLGLAAVPFARYMLISCMIAFPLNAAIILLGDALLQGRGRAALFGLLLLLSVMVAISMVRRRFGAAREPAP